MHQLSIFRRHVRHRSAADAHANEGLNFPRLYDFLVLALTRGRQRAYREAALDLAGIAPGDSVLDIGSGTGTQAIATWRRVQPHGTVVGIDISEKMVMAARRKARRSGLPIDFRQADACRLPFADASFDTATVTTVLHMIPPDLGRGCLHEAARVLKPGGRLLLIDYAGDAAGRRHISARHGRHGRFDLHVLREAMALEGFEAIEAGPLGWLSLHYLRGRKIGDEDA